MDHIEVNNEVTIKSLETNRTPEAKVAVEGRLKDVLDIAIPYFTEEMNVLDLGTKDCLFYDVLKTYENVPLNVRNTMNLVGVDCCPEVIDICQGKGYEVHNLDIQDLSALQDKEFDFIFIIHTLEHVPSPEEVIDECLKIMKPNGYLFVEVPIQQYEDPELWGHYHTFGSHAKVKELFENDFNVVVEDWQKTPSRKPWYRVLFQVK